MKIMLFPLARITVCFVSGILFAAVYAIGRSALILGCICVLLFLVSYLVARKRPAAVFFAVCAGVLSFFIGMATQLAHSETFNYNHYAAYFADSDQNHLIEVVLREKLKNTVKNQRYIAIVRAVDNRKFTGKLLVNIRRDPVDKSFYIGSRLLFRGNIIKNQKPLNPDQFDYGRYLSNKSIFAQIYVNQSAVQVGTVAERNVWYFADRLRSRILTNLKESNFNQKELNVLAALILGQQQDISADVLRDYQYAGAIHILSVSGLHVGFILIFLNFGLKFLPQKRWSTFVHISVVILGLWSFAVIAGLSPSVVRSVTMFSFVAVGMQLRRTTNIYHTLLISIVVILLFQPSFLFDIGFQLSYIALFSIVWLQPMFASLWQPKFKIVKYFYDIFTVSLAAQLGAFPLSLYYFHQFPGLFFITNIIIIPFLSVIMASGVLLMIIATFTTVPHILIGFVQQCILILNTIINHIATIETFIFKDIPLNWQLMTSLYIMIAFTVLWFKKPSFQYLGLAMISILFFQLTCIGIKWNSNRKHELIVFQVRRNSLIAIRNGTRMTALSTVKTATIPELSSYETANFTSKSEYAVLPNVLFFNKNRILVIDSLGVWPINRNPETIVLTQSPKLNLNRLLITQKPKIIIADGSNYRSYITLWKKTCQQQKIPFHATAEKGFYRFSN